MRSLLSLLWILLATHFLWPLIRRTLADSEAAHSPIAVSMTAVACSLGALGTGLYWLGLLPGNWLNVLSALVIIAVGLGIGVFANRAWFDWPNWRQYWMAQWRRLKALDAASLLMWTIIGSLSLILIHALYYPFIGDDALSRYGVQAQWIYASQRLPEKVWGYPPLAPIMFALTWFAAGSVNQHLAKLLSVIAAAGMIGGTFLIGRKVWDERTGFIAAALLAVTPVFIGQAILPYVDIPTGFPLTLAAYFMLLWWQSGSRMEAALIGVLIGVALLTKQSALTWVASATVVPAAWLVGTRRQNIPRRFQRALWGLAGMIIPAFIIAAPWYIRNGLIGGWGNVLPIAGEYHLLEPWVGWIGLLPSLAWPSDFGPALAWVYALGWLVGLAAAGRQAALVIGGRALETPHHFLLAIVLLPYWMAWWSRFSFDARFLALILPVMAVWAARPVQWTLGYIGQHVDVPRWVGQSIGIIFLLGLLLRGGQDQLGGVYRAVTQPFAPEEERIQHVKGDLYNLARYIKQNIEPTSNNRLMIMDGALAFYLPEYNVTVAYPQTLAELEGYEYLVHSSSIYAVYNDRLGWRSSEFYQHVWDPLIFESVYESGGIHIMRILRTDVPSAEEYELSRPGEP